MANKEKYRTVEARREAFNKYCKDRSCKSCGLSNSNGMLECSFQWLAANAEPSIADIVAEMRTRVGRAMGIEDVRYTLEEWRALCNSLEAAALQAYKRIDGAVCNSITDIDCMRKILDETIGGYHG